jgi:phage terminase large subunit
MLDEAIMRAGLDTFFVSTANTITGVNGSQFIFEGLQTARAVSMQSMANIDIVWVEEASTVSQVSLNTLIPTIRKNGSEIWFAWNPRSPRDPVDAMFRKGDIADAGVPSSLKRYYDKWAIVKELQIEDNPFFPEVLKVEMERDQVRDPEKYKHVWRGQYAHRTDSAVFRNWKIEALDVPSGTRPYYGADWGFSVDPTVLVRCYVFPETRVLYIDAEASGVGVEIDKTPALFDSIANGPEDELHPRKWPIMADSARPETISYMSNHGYPQIERARKGSGSVEEGVEFIKSYDVIIHPNCKRVVDEFTFYAYERDKLTDEVLPSLLDKDNHTIDAVRYAVESVRRTVVGTGGFGVVAQPREYFGDPQWGEVQNPALSPVRPGNQPAKKEKGVLW